MLLPVLGSLVVVLGALGCARYHPQPLTAEHALATFEARRLDDPRLGAFVRASHEVEQAAWPPRTWDFSRLLLAAFYFHPDLDTARAAWAVSRGGQITAGQRPNPSVGVAPAFNTTTATPSPWLVTATWDVPIETAGKRAHRQAHAAALATAARLAVVTEAWRVRAAVRTALVALGAARETAARLDAQATLQAESLRLLEAQHAAGEVSAFEVTQTRIATGRLDLARGEAEKAEALARAELAQTIGVPASALDGLPLDFSGLDLPPTEPTLAEARRQAVLTRADVLGALAEYAASEAALALEIARQYPDVHLAPGYEFDQGDDKWALGLTVELPVLHQNQGPIAEAEAGRAAAAARFNALQARVLAEVEQALVRSRTARTQLATAAALRTDLARQARTGIGLLEAGAISRLELVDLRLRLAAADLAWLAAETAAQQARGDLESALQHAVGAPETLLLAAPGRERP